MKSILYKIIVLIGIGIMPCCARAQMKIGNNPASINPNAVLEMESANKGMLLPRVNLTGTNNASPLNDFVAGMTVYNTAVSGNGATAVTPGIYYCDGQQWRRLANPSETGTGLQSIEYNATQGQVNFVPPSLVTDINKIFFYRNGVLIKCTLTGANMVASEVPCDANDDIKIVQFL